MSQADRSDTGDRALAPTEPWCSGNEGSDEGTAIAPLGDVAGTTGASSTDGDPPNAFLGSGGAQSPTSQHLSPVSQAFAPIFDGPFGVCAGSESSITTVTRSSSFSSYGRSPTTRGPVVASAPPRVPFHRLRRQNADETETFD
jgi:hypothetical protein